MEECPFKKTKQLKEKMKILRYEIQKDSVYSMLALALVVGFFYLGFHPKMPTWFSPITTGAGMITIFYTIYLVHSAAKNIWKYVHIEEQIENEKGEDN